MKVIDPNSFLQSDIVKTILDKRWFDIKDRFNQSLNNGTIKLFKLEDELNIINKTIYGNIIDVGGLKIDPLEISGSGWFIYLCNRIEFDFGLDDYSNFEVSCEDQIISGFDNYSRILTNKLKSIGIYVPEQNINKRIGCMRPCSTTSFDFAWVTLWWYVEEASFNR